MCVLSDVLQGEFKLQFIGQGPEMQNAVCKIEEFSTKTI